MQLTAVSLSLLLALISSPANCQSTGSNSSSPSSNSTFLQDCVQGLQSAGFTELANVLFKINGTAPGDGLLARLSSGTNFMLFAPDNQAVQSIQQSISSNASLLAEYLSYHFVQGQFTNTSYANSSGDAGGGSSSSSQTPSSSQTSTDTSTSGSGASTQPSASASAAALFGRLFAPLRRQDGGSGSNSSSSNPQPYACVWPNVTIGRTLLNASELVMLEGNKSQVLVWDRSTAAGNVTILNQVVASQNITVVNGTMWRNILINGINGTLTPPGNLSTALTAVNATAVKGLLSAVQVPAANGTNETALEALQAANGITLFLPNNAAFTSVVNSTVQSLMNNMTAQAALLQNHYVNGSTIYSTEIGNSTQVLSAAGEPLSFMKNDTGLFIMGGNNSVAQVVRPDVLLNNGVAHIIDHVLFDTAASPGPASSAYASAVSEAAMTTTETGPITAVIGGGSCSGQTQSSGQLSTMSGSSTISSSESPSSSASGSSSSQPQSTDTFTQTQTTG